MRLLLSLIITLNLSTLFSQSIDVHVTNIRNNKGSLVFGIFKNEENYKKEAHDIEKSVKKEDIKDGAITVTIPLKPGTYGVTLLDDENDDGKMSYNLVGLPTEGFGFSNHYARGFSRPKYDQFKIEVKETDNDTVFIKLRYIF